MLTQSRQSRIRVLQFLDGALFAVALLVAYGLRAVSATPLSLHPLEAFRGYLWLVPVVWFFGPAALASQGFYEHARLTSRLDLALRTVRGGLLLTLGLILVLFFTREQAARSVVLLVGAFGGILVLARPAFWTWLVRRHLDTSSLRRHVVWVGTPDENARARQALSATDRDHIETVAELDPRTDTARIEHLLHHHAANAVVVSLAGLDPAQVSPILAACEREGVEAVVRPGVFAAHPYRLTLEQFAGETVIHYRAQAAPHAHLAIKHALDYAFGIVLLVACTPLLLVVALLVRLSSPGPILFRQTRAGLNGRPFTLYKFRTMQAGADRRQAELASQNEMRGPVFKIARDPRVTRLGRILRRHSLDELPQLWNVLRGEMSLVGPRPLPVEEVRRFQNHADRRRLSVKPGLTCLWQISGRNDIADFDDWVRLDLTYIDRWSLWLDFKILLATVPVALLGRGGR